MIVRTDRVKRRARFRQQPTRRLIPPVQIHSKGEAISIADKVFEAILIAFILSLISQATGTKLR